MTNDHTVTSLLTPAEVARRLGVSRNTIYKRIHLGEIPAVRLASGGRGLLRIPEAELARWLYSAPDQEAA